MTQPADNTLQILVDVRARLDDLVKTQAELKKIRTEVVSTGQVVKGGFGGLFSTMFGAFTAVNIVSRVASAGLELFTGSIREANDNFEKSRNLDITVQGYNKLRAVVRQSGGDVGALDAAVSNLNENLAKVGEGDEGATRLFQALHVDPVDLQAMSTEDRFVRLARAAKNSGDQLKAWTDLADLIGGGRVMRRMRESLNELADNGFDSVASSATEAEARGTSAIHALFDSFEQNTAVLKSKIVEDFGGGLTLFGYGNEASVNQREVTTADIQKLKNVQQQREALRALQLDLKNVSKANDFITNDPSYTDAQKKFWANSAAAQTIKLLTLLSTLREAMPLDKQTPEDRKAELQGYELEIKALMQSGRTGPSAMTRIREQFENVNAKPTGNNVGNPDYLSPSQGLKAGAMEWVTGLGSTGQQVAGLMQNTIGATVSGISDGIYGWITGTKTFGQALAGLGATVFKAIIDTIVQMGVQWVLTHTLMRGAMLTTNALDQGLRVQRIAGATAEGTATTAAMAPAAATASISSFGLAAVIGIAALVAAMAAFGGFSSGGYTGDMGVGDVAGVVHGQEYVLNAAATSRLGTGFLDALNMGAPAPIGAAPAVFGGQASSMLASSKGRESGRNVHVYLDRSAWLDAVQNDLTGIAHEVYDKRSRA